MILNLEPRRYSPQAQRPLSHAELLNRDDYRGRVAPKVGGRDVFNGEEGELDALLSAS